MTKLLDAIKKVSAFAPATISNVIVGFDILGFPVHAVGDIVTLTRNDTKKIEITDIVGQENLPKDPHKNTAGVAVLEACRHLSLNSGFNIHIKKGIPVSSGMGGSAASAVAALVALNQFFKKPVPLAELLPFALQGEATACGTAHGDNVVPCLYGGLTLIQQLTPLTMIQLPIPDIYCVLVHPHLHIETAYARSILPKTFPLPLITEQSANLALFIAALYKNDLLLLKNSLVDVLIEPIRKRLVRNFSAVKNAALNAGALGCSLSGSGPSLFAFASNKDQATQILAAMQQAFADVHVLSDGWIEKIMPSGAHVLAN